MTGNFAHLQTCLAMVPIVIRTLRPVYSFEHWLRRVGGGLVEQEQVVMHGGFELQLWGSELWSHSWQLPAAFGHWSCPADPEAGPSWTPDSLHYYYQIFSST